MHTSVSVWYLSGGGDKDGGDIVYSVQNKGVVSAPELPFENKILDGKPEREAKREKSIKNRKTACKVATSI